MTNIGQRASDSLESFEQKMSPIMAKKQEMVNRFIAYKLKEIGADNGIVEALHESVADAMTAFWSDTQDEVRALHAATTAEGSRKLTKASAVSELRLALAKASVCKQVEAAEIAANAEGQRLLREAIAENAIAEGPEFIHLARAHAQNEQLQEKMNDAFRRAERAETTVKTTMELFRKTDEKATRAESDLRRLRADASDAKRLMIGALPLQSSHETTLVGVSNELVSTSAKTQASLRTDASKLQRQLDDSLHRRRRLLSVLTGEPPEEEKTETPAAGDEDCAREDGESVPSLVNQDDLDPVRACEERWVESARRLREELGEGGGERNGEAEGSGQTDELELGVAAVLDEATSHLRAFQSNRQTLLRVENELRARDAELLSLRKELGDAVLARDQAGTALVQALEGDHAARKQSAEELELMRRERASRLAADNAVLMQTTTTDTKTTDAVSEDRSAPPRPDGRSASTRLSREIAVEEVRRASSVQARRRPSADEKKPKVKKKPKAGEVDQAVAARDDAVRALSESVRRLQQARAENDDIEMEAARAQLEQAAEVTADKDDELRASTDDRKLLQASVAEAPVPVPVPMVFEGDVEGALKSSRAEVSSLRDQLNAANTRLHTADFEMVSLRSELADARHALHASRRETAAMSELHDKACGALAESQGQLERLCDQLEHEMHEKKQTVAQCHATVRRLHDESQRERADLVTAAVRSLHGLRAHLTTTLSGLRLSSAPGLASPSQRTTTEQDAERRKAREETLTTREDALRAMDRRMDVSLEKERQVAIRGLHRVHGYPPLMSSMRMPGPEHDIVRPAEDSLTPSPDMSASRGHRPQSARERRTSAPELARESPTGSSPSTPRARPPPRPPSSAPSVRERRASDPGHYNQYHLHKLQPSPPLLHWRSVQPPSPRGMSSQADTAMSPEPSRDGSPRQSLVAPTCTPVVSNPKSLAPWRHAPLL